MQDWVGLIKNELEALGFLENSVLIYSSDNGAPEAENVRGRNYPLRGYKREIWEGGTMVPGLVWTTMESLIPISRRGSKSHEMYHVTDWKPTIMRLAGIDPSALNPSLPLDGYDVWDSISNGTIWKRIPWHTQKTWISAVQQQVPKRNEGRPKENVKLKTNNKN